MTGKGTCLHVSTICFWVAGGFSTVKLYNRIRGDRLRGVQKVIYRVLPCLWPPRVSNRSLKHQKPQFFLGRTEVSPRVLCAGRLHLGLQIHQKSSPEAQKPFIFKGIPRILWSGGPFFRSFRSLTHTSTQMRPSKQPLVLKKLMYSSDRCSHDHRWSLNVELPAMSNYLQCRTTCSVCLQCRTACNVELVAMSNYLQCVPAMSNCLQCRTTCNVELLAMLNYLQC